MSLFCKVCDRERIMTGQIKPYPEDQAVLCCHHQRRYKVGVEEKK